MKFEYGVHLETAETDEYLNGCVEKGWHPLIKELISKIKKIDKNIKVEQVKEKFGGLRFYISPAVKEVFDLISEYESKSYETCEFCGKKGKLRTDLPWYKTLCSSHYKAKLEELASRRHSSR